MHDRKLPLRRRLYAVVMRGLMLVSAAFTGGLVLFLAPIALLTCIFAYDIVSIVYLRGEFDAAAAQITAQALVGFAVGFPLIAVREMFIRLHLAYQNTRMPMLANVAAVALNAALSIVLAQFIGILGVALATSLSVLLTIFLLNRSVRQYIPQHRFSQFLPLFARTAAACALSGAAAVFLRGALPLGLLPRFMVTVVCAAAIYLAALLALRCPELTGMFGAVRTKLDKKREKP